MYVFNCCINVYSVVFFLYHSILCSLHYLTQYVYVFICSWKRKRPDWRQSRTWWLKVLEILCSLLVRKKKKGGRRLLNFLVFEYLWLTSFCGLFFFFLSVLYFGEVLWLVHLLNLVMVGSILNEEFLCLYFYFMYFPMYIYMYAVNVWSTNLFYFMNFSVYSWNVYSDFASVYSSKWQHFT